MNKNLFIAAIIITCLVSCNSKTAFNYSEDFVTKERSLMPVIDSVETKVGIYVTAQQFDSMSMVSKVAEKRFDAVINEVRANPAPSVKEGDHFKAEILRYLEYLKSIYTAYREYAEGTAEQREAIKARITDIVARKETVVADIKSAQRAFADANGFRIERDK